MATSHDSTAALQVTDKRLIPEAQRMLADEREMRLLRETFSAWVSRTFDPEDDEASDDDSVPIIRYGWFTIRTGRTG